MFVRAMPSSKFASTATMSSDVVRLLTNAAYKKNMAIKANFSRVTNPLTSQSQQSPVGNIKGKVKEGGEGEICLFGAAGET